MDVKEEKAAKAEFELHVLLIMRQDGVSKSRAQVRAWFEGREGVDRRTGQKVLPLKNGSDK